MKLGINATTSTHTEARMILNSECFFTTCQYIITGTFTDWNSTTNKINNSAGHKIPWRESSLSNCQNTTQQLQQWQRSGQWELEPSTEICSKTLYDIMYRFVRSQQYLYCITLLLIELTILSRKSCMFIYLNPSSSVSCLTQFAAVNSNRRKLFHHLWWSYNRHRDTCLHYYHGWIFITKSDSANVMQIDLNSGCGWYVITSMQQCVSSLAQKLNSKLALQMSFVVSSKRSKLPRRMLAWLSQCVSTAQRDVEHRWTAWSASSLGIVGVRRCTAERKLTEPYEQGPLFCTGCAVGHWTGSQWRDCNSSLAWTHLRCWQMTWAMLFWALCSFSTTATGALCSSELQ